MEQDDGRVGVADGSREPSPAVSTLTGFDPARVAASLPQEYRPAFAAYPSGWTDHPLPMGWSGTAIGRVPLVDVDAQSFLRRVNARGAAVQEVLLDFGFGAKIINARRRPKCSGCLKPASRAGEGVWEWNCDCHIFRDSDTRRQAEAGTGSVRSKGSVGLEGHRQ